MDVFLQFFLINMSYTDCDIAAVLFNKEVHMVVTNSSDCCLNEWRNGEVLKDGGV